MFALSRLSFSCSIAATLLGLSGCGQKGPLFMPTKQPGMAPVPMAVAAPTQLVIPSPPTIDGPAGITVPDTTTTGPATRGPR